MTSAKARPRMGAGLFRSCGRLALAESVIRIDAVAAAPLLLAVPLSVWLLAGR